MSAKILLILGSGGNIGASTASKFAANGFKVALAARSLVTGTSPEGYHTFKFDAADPSSIKLTFEAVRAALGTPNVVLFNGSPRAFLSSWRLTDALFSESAAAHTPNADPFGVSLEEFTKSLNINTTSAYAAAGEALKGLDALKLAGEDLTFLYTGNGQSPFGHQIGETFLMRRGYRSEHGQTLRVDARPRRGQERLGAFHKDRGERVWAQGSQGELFFLADFSFRNIMARAPSLTVLLRRRAHERRGSGRGQNLRPRARGRVLQVGGRQGTARGDLYFRRREGLRRVLKGRRKRMSFQQS